MAKEKQQIPSPAEIDEIRNKACPLRSLWFLLPSAAFTLHAAAWIAERTLDFALLTGHPL